MTSLQQLQHPNTEEQNSIIEAAKTDQSFKTNAFAGSGKTSTCVLVGKALKNKKGNYLAFNKVIADEAKKKFTSNVECTTFHSRAWRGVDRAVTSKTKNQKRLFPNNIASKYNLGKMQVQSNEGDIRSLTTNEQAHVINRSLAKFCNSVGEDFQLWMVENSLPAWVPKGCRGEIASRLLPHVESRWLQSINPRDEYQITHDIYLKVWALSNPKLSTDFILFDEAQDADPLMLDVMNKQKDTQIIFVGDKHQSIYCQPKGTLVKVCQPLNPNQSKTFIKDISEIEVGDNVLSYNIEHAHLHRRGKPVTKVGTRQYKGNMLTVKLSDDKTTKYTHDHHSIIRLGKTNEGKFVTYVMRKGNQYRIGKVPWAYSSNGGQFGLSGRATAENADAYWILGLHDTQGDAVLTESYYAYKYGIPQNCFVDRSLSKELHLDIDKFWSMIGDNTENAKQVLCHFGRDINYPIWSMIESDDKVSTRLRFKSSFITASCNLMVGMELATDIESVSRGKIQNQHWKSIDLIESNYVEETVYSLEVADDHTYVADDILTHNCWRGAVNAMQSLQLPEQRLTQSFRFGGEVADTANILLNHLGERIPLIGNPEKDSKCSHEHQMESPDAVLCRTNIGVITALMQGIEGGKKVSAQLDTAKIITILDGVEGLKQGKVSTYSELSGFTSYSDLEQAAEGDDIDPDVKQVIKLLSTHKADKIRHTLESVGKNSAKDSDYIISTAHKAKGMEWGNVQIHNDFFFKIDGSVLKVSDDELRLLYVACTRAQNNLNTYSIDALLKHKGVRGY